MSSLKNISVVETTKAKIPQVSASLNFCDYWGAIKVRWGIKRDSYKVNPGLYAIGNPDKASDVFVTANYKLSFDHLRKNLAGLNAWILVLDTKGVNVWCAAGKGTFGTAELVRQIQLTGLHQIVDHRRIIVPQLGATGIAAHIVKKETVQAGEYVKDITSTIPKLGLAAMKPETGFRVIYGPVYAKDIKAFIEAGYKATEEMRKIRFPLWERVKLVPNDFMYGKKQLFTAFLLFFLISIIGKWNVPFNDVVHTWLVSVLNIFTAYISGIVFTPVLLPFIPIKRFAFKGVFVSILTSMVLWKLQFFGQDIGEIISWFLINAAVASFVAMNFTGSSTYTSLSGVKKEMKVAIPVQLSFAILGLTILLITKLRIL